jgi:pimeloyl-ACP methyl ester carboxylesterase
MAAAPIVEAIPSMTPQSTTYDDITFTARDGLKLHVRRYRAAGGGAVGRPLLCLPGLTRNGRDFHDLAQALSHHPSKARTVYTFDYRGRGLSEFDPNWKNYTVTVEMLDVLDFLTMEGLTHVAVLGTSRGGLITMLMAATQPAAIGVAILNDIGPVIEHDGLVRISGYVGRVPLPISWADAAKMVRDLNRRHFPDVPEHVWEQVARQWYNERNGRPVPGYDRNLSKTLSVLYGPLPELWPQFGALGRVPVMVLHGEKSDVLSAATVDEMRRRHSALTTLTVPGQGHAPLLMDHATIDAVRHFLQATEADETVAVRAIA